jgi:hypothetical protein
MERRDMTRATNPPQHSAGDYGALPVDKPVREGLPTGAGTGGVKDVADPHPADEEHPYRAKHPGGAAPPRDTTQKVNPYTHTGTPPRRPKNAETD